MEDKKENSFNYSYIVSVFKETVNRNYNEIAIIFKKMNLSL